MERDGISEELARSILRAQLSIEEKKGYCDLVIDNSGTVEETRQKVAELWETLKDLQWRREQEA
jgi:dephospho-CoA kinase